MTSSTTKTGKKRSGTMYTKDQLNYLIDAMIHPLHKMSEDFVLVDGILHGLIEQNPHQSVRKFLKYNLQAIMKEASRLLKWGAPTALVTAIGNACDIE